jgi:hypothetical protein
MAGGLPARRPELLSLTVLNTINSIRHAFFVDSRLIIVQRYGKSSGIQQKDRMVSRFHCERVSNLAAKCLLFLIPLRNVILFKLGHLRDEQLSKPMLICNARGNSVSPDTLSYQFEKLTHKCINKKLPFQTWRHFIIALTERKLKIRDWDLFNNAIETMSHQSGHGIQTRINHYGHTNLEPAQMARDQFELMRLVSEQYHELMGIATPSSSSSSSVSTQLCLQQPTIPSHPTHTVTRFTEILPVVLPHQTTSEEETQVIPDHCFQLALNVATRIYEKEYFTAFKSVEQSQAVAAVLEEVERDCLIQLKTGGGKSLCYEIWAHAQPSHLAVVILPLETLLYDAYRRLKVCRS